MTDYVKSTAFGPKDDLDSGVAAKRIKGVEFDTEFDNIATAVQTKANSASPTLTGTPLAPTASSGTNTTQLATTAFVATAITDERTATATLTNKTLTSPTVSGLSLSDSNIVFEGATANDYETTLTVVDPTADRTITFPDATTTVVGTDVTQTLTNKTIVNKLYQSSITAVSALDIDCSVGNYFTKAIKYNSTFTFSNAPSNVAYGFMLELTQIATGGTYTQTGTTVTVTSNAHGLLAGNTITADITSGTGVDGTYTITAVTTDTFTYTAGTSLTTSGNISVSGTVTWPDSVKWPYDSAPSLTAGKTHLFVFITDDSGSRWRGAALVDYTN